MMRTARFGQFCAEATLVYMTVVSANTPNAPSPSNFRFFSNMFSSD